MEPKVSLQASIEEFFENLQAEPEPRNTLYESLQISKSVYDSEVTKMSQQNIMLQHNLENCQRLLYELSQKMDK
jgi:hypothetical protein